MHHETEFHLLMTKTDTIVLFQCTECGKLSTSLGSLHAHCERHRGLFGLQFPWRYGDFDALMAYTDVIEVTDYEIHDEITAEMVNAHA